MARPLRLSIREHRVGIPPTSVAFTLLLGLLVALPSFGIEMSLPALTATGATLRIAPALAGLTMSLFMPLAAYLLVARPAECAMPA